MESDQPPDMPLTRIRARKLKGQIATAPLAPSPAITRTAAGSFGGHSGERKGAATVVGYTTTVPPAGGGVQHLPSSTTLDGCSVVHGVDGSSARKTTGFFDFSSPKNRSFSPRFSFPPNDVSTAQGKMDTDGDSDDAKVEEVSMPLDLLVKAKPNEDEHAFLE